MANGGCLAWTVGVSIAVIFQRRLGFSHKQEKKTNSTKCGSSDNLINKQSQLRVSDMPGAVLCAFLTELCLTSTKPRELHGGIVPGPDEKLRPREVKAPAARPLG